MVRGSDTYLVSLFCHQWADVDGDTVNDELLLMLLVLGADGEV